MLRHGCRCWKAATGRAQRASTLHAVILCQADGCLLCRGGDRQCKTRTTTRSVCPGLLPPCAVLGTPPLRPAARGHSRAKLHRVPKEHTLEREYRGSLTSRKFRASRSRAGVHQHRPAPTCWAGRGSHCLALADGAAVALGGEPSVDAGAVEGVAAQQDAEAVPWPGILQADGACAQLMAGAVAAAARAGRAAGAALRAAAARAAHRRHPHRLQGCYTVAGRHLLLVPGIQGEQLLVVGLCGMQRASAGEGWVACTFGGASRRCRSVGGMHNHKRPRAQLL